METLSKNIFALTYYDQLETNPKNSNKGITRDPITTGNGKHISFGIGFTGLSFSYNNSLPWYFSSCWVPLEAHKVIMPIKRIKTTHPLALPLARMSCYMNVIQIRKWWKPEKIRTTEKESGEKKAKFD